MPLVFILEDDRVDLRKAADLARKAGFTEVQSSAFASEARVYLERAISGLTPPPDAMVIDLDLGLESGFELLRFWHGSRQLKAIPVIIWTAMGNREREICRLFGVTMFVSKEHGSPALTEALRSLIPDLGAPDARSLA